MDKVFLKLDNLQEALIIKRPSRYIKSPYVADIDIDGVSYLGHTPSLGCCGLAEKDKNVYVSKLGDKTKCQYRVELSLTSNGVIVGISPKLAEKIVYSALKQQSISGLSVRSLAKEYKILNSRFDFIGETCENRQFILEVKSVPLVKDNIAYFPDGYRKKKTDTISERAVKHITELMNIKQMYNEIRCILLFVIQREDAHAFQPSRDDGIYLNALRKAWLEGVEIKTLQVKWDNLGCCSYVSNSLPIILFDNYDVCQKGGL